MTTDMKITHSSMSKEDAAERDFMVSTIYEDKIVPWIFVGVAAQGKKRVITGSYSTALGKLSDKDWKNVKDHIIGTVKKIEFERYKKSHDENN